MKSKSILLVIVLGLVAGSIGESQDSKAPVKVVVKDGKSVLEEASLPVDPTPRIVVGHFPGGGFNFGLSVDNQRICCSPQGSIWIQARIDGQILFLGQDPQRGGGAVNPKPLPAGPFNKKRLGQIWTWQYQDLVFTQIVEIVPSKPTTGKVTPGQKRRLDTARISYLVENKGKKARKIELRQGIDTLIVNNDGCLFASPTHHKGKILNGVELKDKGFPDFLHVLEKPDLNNPGFVATMTFKMGGKAQSPNRIVLTQLGQFNAWEVPAVQAGDSACAIYWAPHDLQPNTKREFAWGYGGGYASNPDNDATVSLALGGSFEPKKSFTITAYVDDPMPDQTLTLELPAGMERLEGKEVQAVPNPTATTATSVVMWKARVLRPGNYEVKVRSSSGVTQSKHISITVGN
jgi:hypothetical protein